ncbi:hypothetical protein ACFVXQ_13700, partial [Kitasatospora sp. NPDC058263]
PDQLDWHGSMEAYADDMGRIYEGNVVACVYNLTDPADPTDPTGPTGNPPDRAATTGPYEPPIAFRMSRVSSSIARRTVSRSSVVFFPTW